jgi:hypothetical protein
MLNTNVDAVSKQLQDYAKTMERKLVNMVAGFAENVATSASDNTPVGNATDLDEGLSSDAGSAGSYARLYLQRYRDNRIAPEVGYHAGAWKYSENLNLIFDPSILSKEQSTSEVLADTRVNYKVGQTF